MMVNRLLEQWECLPALLRKPAMPDHITSLQKACSAFMLAKSLFAQLVPTEVMHQEWSNIERNFECGCMDDALVAAVDDGPWPWDLAASFPEVKAILARLERETENKHLARNRELRDQVQLATFTQLADELTEDIRKLTAYFVKLSEIRSHRADQVLAYKRKRYNRGLECVRKLLDRRLNMLLLDAGSTAMEYSAFTLLDSLPFLKSACLAQLSLLLFLMSGYIFIYTCLCVSLYIKFKLKCFSIQTASFVDKCFF
jgi:hypothetical protein